MFGIHSMPFEALAVVMIVLASGFIFSILTDVITWFAHAIAKWD